jgi:hypothetical protein
MSVCNYQRYSSNNGHITWRPTGVSACGSHWVGNPQATFLLTWLSWLLCLLNAQPAAQTYRGILRDDVIAQPDRWQTPRSRKGQWPQKSFNLTGASGNGQMLFWRTRQVCYSMRELWTSDCTRVSKITCLSARATVRASKLSDRYLPNLVR